MVGRSSALWLTLRFGRPRLFWRRRRPLRRRRRRLSEEPARGVRRRGFWSAQVGSGARAAGAGTRGKRRSPGFGGALRLSGRPRAVRGGARLPELRRGGQTGRSHVASTAVPLSPLEARGCFVVFCFFFLQRRALHLPPPTSLGPRSPPLTRGLTSLAGESLSSEAHEAARHPLSPSPGGREGGEMRIGAPPPCAAPVRGLRFFCCSHRPFYSRPGFLIPELRWGPGPLLFCLPRRE